MQSHVENNTACYGLCTYISVAIIMLIYYYGGHAVRFWVAWITHANRCCIQIIICMIVCCIRIHACIHSALPVCAEHGFQLSFNSV